MSNVNISVIVPVYNCERFLKKCLDSIFAQTLKEIEVICIDDGSTDKSSEILDRYISKYSNLILIVNQKNKGAWYARNEALKIAKGKYVCFMDGDDYYPKNDIFDFFYSLCKKFRCDIVGGSFQELRQSKFLKLKYHFSAFRLTFNKGYTFKKNSFIDFINYQFDYGYTRFFYNLNFLRNNNLEFPCLKRFEDPIFLANCLIKGNKIYACKKISYCYRIGYHKSTIYSNSKLHDYLIGNFELLKIAFKNNCDNLISRIGFHLLDVFFEILGRIQRNDGITEEIVYKIKQYCINNKIYNKYINYFFTLINKLKNEKITNTKKIGLNIMIKLKKQKFSMFCEI